ncbi:MAG TPA: hypothetical protein VF817_01495 [Patescibacteria group bacterium]
MASGSFVKKFTNNALNKTSSVGSYICATLWELGEVTADTFFNPNYSFTKPTRILFGLDARSAYNKNINHDALFHAIKRLKAQGIVKKKGAKWSLTSLGKKTIEKIASRERVLGKKWDKKYRLVIFDIPEKKRNARNWLRGELYTLEYSQLQMSVFIGKHALPEDVVKDIKRHGIEKHVNYLLAQEVFDNKRMNNFKK